MVLLNCQSHFINGFTDFYFENFLAIHLPSNKKNFNNCCLNRMQFQNEHAATA